MENVNNTNSKIKFKGIKKIKKKIKNQRKK